MIDRRENSRIIRGLCSLIIIMTHLCAYIKGHSFFTGLSRYGFLAVGIYIFYSAYNLMYSYLHKDNFKKDFIKKKLINIYFPFVIVNFIILMINIILKGYKYSNYEYMSYLLGKFRVQDILWYVYFIIYLYIAFYIVMFFNRSKKRSINTILSFIIITFFAFIYRNEELTIQRGLPILFGFIFCIFEDIYIKYKDNPIFDYIKVISIILLLLSFNSIFNNSHRILCFNHPFDVLAVFFIIILVILYSYNYNFKNKVLDFFSDISYETYIVHPIFLIFYSSKPFMITNPIIFFIVYFISTILLSIIINKSKGYLKELLINRA